MTEYSPEFTEFSPNAVSVCIFHGAAKIGGLITAKTIESMNREHDLGRLYEVYDGQIPELEPLLTKLTAQNRSIRTSLLKNTIRGVEEVYEVNSHKDEGQSGGITIIMPISGDPAHFAADEAPFTLPGEIQPKLNWLYGPGDAILLRHVIIRKNGRRLPAMQHLGRSRTHRRLTFIVIDNPNLEIPN